jgi:pimeloyl-ACP methyl ester carboxylesterase
VARFVLVHGAFGGAWCWEPVIRPLEAAGHTAEALDLPGGGDDTTPAAEITLEACAARVGDVLASSPEPAILVGVSMGGVVITQAAGNDPDRVAALVFVAAFMPSNGQSLLDLSGLPEGKNDMIQANVVVEGDPPVATLPRDVTAQIVFDDCTPEQQAWALSKRTPQAVAPYATPVRVDDDFLAAIPRFYVLTASDRSLPPALQRRMIREHPCERVFELEAGHAPYLSATQELVDALNEVAELRTSVAT